MRAIGWANAPSDACAQRSSASTDPPLRASAAATWRRASKKIGEGRRARLDATQPRGIHRQEAAFRRDEIGITLALPTRQHRRVQLAIVMRDQDMHRLVRDRPRKRPFSADPPPVADPVGGDVAAVEREDCAERPAHAEGARAGQREQPPAPTAVGQDNRPPQPRFGDRAGGHEAISAGEHDPQFAPDRLRRQDRRRPDHRMIGKGKRSRHANDNGP